MKHKEIILKKVKNKCKSHYSIPSIVTILGSNCFQFSLLRSILIPNNIKKIGNFCFHYSLNLKEIKFEENKEIVEFGNKIFQDCSELREVSLPNVSIISEGLFENCDKLEKINIPKTVTIIEDRAFKECISLNNINFPIDSKLTEIRNEAFKGCYSLKKITLPSTLRILYPNVFKNCISLSCINFPENISTIWEGVFEGTKIQASKSIRKLYFEELLKITDSNKKITSEECENLSIKMSLKYRQFINFEGLRSIYKLPIYVSELNSSIDTRPYIINVLASL